MQATVGLASLLLLLALVRAERTDSFIYQYSTSDGSIAVYDGEWKHVKETYAEYKAAYQSSDAVPVFQWRKHGRGKLSINWTTTGAWDVYEGDYVDGSRHGRGTHSFSDGRHFVGQWIDDRMRHGTFTFIDGNVYTGEYRNSKMNGRGKYTHTGGDVYDGEWVDNFMHGHGVYTYTHGGVYVGEWKHSKADGHGEYTASFGKKHVGLYKNGKKHGKGKYSSGNQRGAYYEGNYKNDLRHGRGKQTWSATMWYEGWWKEDRTFKRGKYIAEESRYDGEHKDNKPHGHGTFTSCKNGHSTCGSDTEDIIYTGDWKEGQFHGRGNLTSVLGGEWRDLLTARLLTPADGAHHMKHAGEWRENEPINPATAGSIITCDGGGNCCGLLNQRRVLLFSSQTGEEESPTFGPRFLVAS